MRSIEWQQSGSARLQGQAGVNCEGKQSCASRCDDYRSRRLMVTEWELLACQQM